MSDLNKDKDHFTLLTKEQLDIFDSNLKAFISDFAILSGGEFYDHLNEEDYNNELESQDPRCRTGSYWILDGNNNDKLCAMYCIGHYIDNDPKFKLSSIGVRPVIPYSSIKSEAKIDEFSDMPRFNHENNFLVKFGEYPQTAAPCSSYLEQAYSQGKLETTGRTFRLQTLNEYNEIVLKEYIEYMTPSGEKFIRVKANLNNSTDDKFTILSNNLWIKNGEIEWIEVKPVEWYVDEEHDIAISRNILFAGIPNRTYDNNNIIPFNNTNIKKFLDEYFEKDICGNYPDKLPNDKDETLIDGLKQKSNYYNLIPTSKDGTMPIFDFNFLANNELFKDKEVHINEEAFISDFAILLGGSFVEFDTPIRCIGGIIDEKAMLRESRIGDYWVSTGFGNEESAIIGHNKNFVLTSSFDSSIGVRPIIRYSAIKPFSFDPEYLNVESLNKWFGPYGWHRGYISFGKYPQNCMDVNNNQLTKDYNEGELKETGRTYKIQTVNSSGKIETQELLEYEYKPEYQNDYHETFVRVKANFKDGKPTKLSDGHIYSNGDMVWVAVSDVQWCVNEEKDIAISQDILFAGVPYKTPEERYVPNFKYTHIKHFMDQNLAKDLFAGYLVPGDNQDLLNFSIDENFKSIINDVFNGNYDINKLQKLNDQQKYTLIVLLSAVKKEEVSKIANLIYSLCPQYLETFFDMWSSYGGRDRIFKVQRLREELDTKGKTLQRKKTIY